MSNIGLVLGAGGCAGIAFHAGVLAAVNEVSGWDAREARVIVGSSAGSLSGALLRFGLSPDDLCAYTEGRAMTEEGQRLTMIGQPHRPRAHAFDFLRPRGPADISALRGAVLHPRRMLSASMACALMPEGPVSTEPISDGLTRVSGGRWPDQPLWVNAVRLSDGRRTVFGRPGSPRADIGHAVAASCAIPGFYKPVEIGERRYVDGGVASFHNLDLLNDVGLDLVIVSAPMSYSGRAVSRVDMSVRRVIRAQMHKEVDRLRQKGTEVVVVEPDLRVLKMMGLDPMDARPRAAISRLAREETSAMFSGLGLRESIRAAGGTVRPTLPSRKIAQLRHLDGGGITAA